MVICFVQKKIFGRKHELEYLSFLSRKAQFFFLQISTLAYMTKTLNQIFFPSTKIRIFFSATLVIRIFFLENFAVYCENFL